MIGIKIMSSKQIYLSVSNGHEFDLEKRLSYLVDNGFTNLELSGGGNYTHEIIRVLTDYQRNFGVKFRVHNYFPPPKKHFVLNLGSSEPVVEKRSIEHVKKAIQLCAKIEAPEYGIHAAFRGSFGVDDLGQSSEQKFLEAEEKVCNQFMQNYRNMSEFAKGYGVKLYVENNVIGAANFAKHEAQNPFLLTSFADYLGLQKLGDMNVLLDVAHLSVSCNVLKLDFNYQLNHFLEISDYIHISDNDGYEDQNKALKETGRIWTGLMENKKLLRDKKITLEVYDGPVKLKECIRMLEGIYSN